MRALFRSLAGQGWEGAGRAGRPGHVDAAVGGLFGRALGLRRGAALADVVGLCPRLAGDAAGMEEVGQGWWKSGSRGSSAGPAWGGGHRGAGAGREFLLRERLAGQVMVALYRCGGGGRRWLCSIWRRVLASELGLDPGPELAQIHAKVLADDPSLAAPQRRCGAARRRVCTPGGGVPRQLPGGAGYFAGRRRNSRLWMSS